MPPYNAIFYELEVITQPLSSVDDPFNMLPFSLDYEGTPVDYKAKAYREHEMSTNHGEMKIFADYNDHQYSIFSSDEVLQSLEKPELIKIKAHPFIVNSTNGEISLASHLDRETNAEYR